MPPKTNPVSESSELSMNSCEGEFTSFYQDLYINYHVGRRENVWNIYKWCIMGPDVPGASEREGTVAGECFG